MYKGTKGENYYLYSYPHKIVGPSEGVP